MMRRVVGSFDAVTDVVVVGFAGGVFLETQCLQVVTDLRDEVPGHIERRFTLLDLDMGANQTLQLLLQLVDITFVLADLSHGDTACTTGILQVHREVLRLSAQDLELQLLLCLLLCLLLDLLGEEPHGLAEHSVDLDRRVTEERFLLKF